MYKKNLAFTLTELLITVSIIGIVAGIATYSGSSNISKTRIINGLTLLEGPKSLIINYYQKYGKFPAELKDIGLDPYVLTDNSFYKTGDATPFNLMYYTLQDGATTSGKSFSSFSTGVGVGFMLKKEYIPDNTTNTVGGYIGFDIVEAGGEIQLICTTCDAPSCSLDVKWLPKSCYHP